MHLFRYTKNTHLYRKVKFIEQIWQSIKEV